MVLGCVIICFMFISGFSSFILIKVISFVGNGFLLRVAGQSRQTGFS